MIHFRFCSYAPSLTSQRCQLKELFSSNKGGRTLTPCFFELLEGTTKQAIHISKNRPPPSLQLSLLPTNMSLTWSLTSFYLLALPSIFMRRCYYFGRGCGNITLSKEDPVTTWHCRTVAANWPPAYEIGAPCHGNNQSHRR